ncbi:helix-hairpin-helix domain-containing protein [Pseudothermotoga sp.]|nr:DNA polymerase III subunit alpha [Pseudothermotoga sp.]MDW8139797.1 DNA polymerase III subunit alpha [Pseudothermotoga sp.]
MIACIVSPYSFEGSIVRFEDLAIFVKENKLRSLLLADVNLHGAVHFHTFCRKLGLVPVLGLRKGNSIYYARNREEYEELVRSYNERREPKLNRLSLNDVELIYYLQKDDLEAHRVMCQLLRIEPQVNDGPSGKFDDVASLLKVHDYDLRVVHRLPDPPENWLDDIVRRSPLEYKKRLMNEIDIVRKLGFEPYFYTVKCIVDVARQNGIIIGPGRGSAVGSLLAHLLGITSVDPVRYGLMFERFLHEQRREPPDIDIDVADEQRSKLLYLLRNVFPYFAQISTFSTLTEKALMNEVKRLNIDLKGDVVKRIVGLPYRRSVHAAGIVVSQEPLNLPLVPFEDQKIIEYDMDSIEQIGVVKIDLLGLRTLTALDEIRRKVGIESVDLNDVRTYKLISNGKTSGIFQLEAQGARRLCRTVRPSNLEELSTLLALNRPGPLRAKMDKLYAERKRGCIDIEQTLFPETFGVIVYQEQVMKLAMDLAGFSPAEADLFRKAISEKDESIIERTLVDFKSKLIEKGYKPRFVQDVCGVLKKFALYAFNKSHSVAYSLLSFELAYLKAHWPKQFFELYMRENASDQNKIFHAVQELRSMGFRVLPPSVNHTLDEEKTFRLPLEVVSGVGKTVTQLCQKLGPFSNLKEFYERTKLPLSILQKLVWAGVFDELHSGRVEALEAFETLQKGFDETLSQLAAKVFGKQSESRKKLDYNEADLASLEEKAYGFPLTPFKFDFSNRFAPLSEIFATGRTLPVVVKVSKNFASDGSTIVRLKERVADGYFVLALTPDGRVLRQEKAEKVKRVVYELYGCFDENDLEEASEHEFVETSLCGKKVEMAQLRPLVDWYEISWEV